MSALATHPCDACGGFAYLCSGCSGGGRYWDVRHSCVRIACPVCLGAGRFPDRMPAADAVADAETLILELRRIFPSTRWFEMWGEDGLHLRVATMLGEIEGGGSHVRWTASLAARQAFRVAPMLRVAS